MKQFVFIIVILLCSPQTRGQAAVPCVRAHVTNLRITQHEFDAMVDFTFNVGCHAFAKSTLLKKVNSGDINGAAAEFPKWVHVNGVVLRGLVKRRNDERNLFLEGGK